MIRDYTLPNLPYFTYTQLAFFCVKLKSTGLWNQGQYKEPGKSVLKSETRRKSLVARKRNCEQRMVSEKNSTRARRKRSWRRKRWGLGAKKKKNYQKLEINWKVNDLLIQEEKYNKTSSFRIELFYLFLNEFLTFPPVPQNSALTCIDIFYVFTSILW